MSGLASLGAWRWIAACTWRFGLAGPPLGAAIVIVPAMLLSAAAPNDVIGGWLFFSIFSYLFALPAALVAGLLYGIAKQHTGHPSRWLLGGLCGVLGWLVQDTALAVFWQDSAKFSSAIILPLPAMAGSLCARLLTPARHAPPREATTATETPALPPHEKSER